jgi:hypothetical protein
LQELGCDLGSYVLHDRLSCPDAELQYRRSHEERPQRSLTRAFTCLAPRPGLEPGTYGLTEQHTANFWARKLKICIAFFGCP